MDYFRRTLPSLDALVFFEAAARHRNFTRAAEELKVSQVAVSKRIHALEAALGTVLFQRQGRSLDLTPQGQALFERSRAGLAFLEEAITATRSGAKRPRQIIQVAANENVNFFWLAPLVRDFQMAGNEAIVSVVTANNVADVVQAETDLAIFYGKTAPEGWETRPLFDEMIVPLVSPAYRARLNAGEPPVLLDYRKEAPEWVNWKTLGPGKARWFPAAKQLECSSYIQSISHALEGRGIGLGVVPMLHREVGAGQLILATPAPIWTGHSYFLATPKGRPVKVATQALIEAMVKAAGQQQTSP